MKTWKSCPGLFNGFSYICGERIIDKGYAIPDSDGRMGIVENGLREKLRVGSWISIDASSIMLVARRFKDITEEEANTWKELTHYINNNDYVETQESMLYLITRKVYPFSGFDFGRVVMDINEVTKLS